MICSTRCKYKCEIRSANDVQMEMEESKAAGKFVVKRGMDDALDASMFPFEVRAAVCSCSVALMFRL